MGSTHEGVYGDHSTPGNLEAGINAYYRKLNEREAQTAREAEARQIALKALTDDELEMTRLHLEAKREDLYYIEGRGLDDIIEPEDIPYESELGSQIGEVELEQIRRRMADEAA